MITAKQLEVDIPIDTSTWTYGEIHDYGRRLAIAVFLNTLSDARNGDPDARIWLTGWCAEYLDALGLESLATLADIDLDAILERVNLRHLENYLLGTYQRCFDCTSCVLAHDGRGGYKCLHNRWSKASFAATTVRYSPKMQEYQPCEDFSRKEQANDAAKEN